jgi:hypothetical protein
MYEKCKPTVFVINKPSVGHTRPSVLLILLTCSSLWYPEILLSPFGYILSRGTQTNLSQAGLSHSLGSPVFC